MKLVYFIKHFSEINRHKGRTNKLNFMRWWLSMNAAQMFNFSTRVCQLKLMDVYLNMRGRSFQRSWSCKYNAMIFRALMSIRDDSHDVFACFNIFVENTRQPPRNHLLFTKNSMTKANRCYFTIIDNIFNKVTSTINSIIALTQEKQILELSRT